MPGWTNLIIENMNGEEYEVELQVSEGVNGWDIDAVFFAGIEVDDVWIVDNKFVRKVEEVYKFYDELLERL